MVGFSFGAFVAMCLKVKCQKIIINLCLVPTVELPKLDPLPGKPVPSPQLIASYRPYEAKVFDHITEGTHCFMAELEVESETITFPLPPFVGTEVTGDKRYYNSQLRKVQK